MFEEPTAYASSRAQKASRASQARVLAPEGEPLEFLYQGRHYRVHSIISRWRESGGWWNRITDGNNHLSEENLFDDGGKAIWSVEAAPIGTVATFDIELDELTKIWHIRPTSRPTHSGR